MRFTTLILLTTLLAVTTSIRSQDYSVCLLDSVSGSPVVGAAFQYGYQSGISDTEGRIFISYTISDTLLLSHLNYGVWSVLPSEVHRALDIGAIYRSPDFKDIKPVTIISMHQKAEKSRTLSFSDKDRLSHDGGAVLTQIPAISVIRKGGNYGFDPVLRGFKYDQLNLIVDGCQCALAACPNRMDPPSSQVAPNMVERVEVLKGPHALRFGNSFGGTINYISEDPGFTDKIRPFGRISTAWESNGNLIRSEGMVGIHNAHTELGFYSSLSKGNDYHDGRGEKVSSAFKRGSAGLNLANRIGKSHLLKFSVTRNFARDVKFAALPMDLRTDDTWLLNAKHLVKFRNRKLNNWETMIYGSLVDHFMDNRLKDSPPLEAETGARTTTYGGRTEGTWLFRKIKLYTGFDIRFESASGERIRFMPNGNEIRDNAWQAAGMAKAGTFGELHYVQRNYKLILSGRMERNESHVLDASPEFTTQYPDISDTDYNPALSLGGVLTPGDKFSLGLWLGRVSRSPGITERFINYFPVGLDPYEMLGNPNLDPEINSQADLVTAYSLEKLRLELDIFTSYIQQYISSEIDADLQPRLPSSPGVRRYENIGSALLSGFEFALVQTLGAGLKHHMAIAYTYGIDPGENTPLPEIAPLDIRYQIQGSFLRNNLLPELNFRYAGRQDRISEAFGESNTPAFFLMDIVISYRILNGLMISAAVNNVFDKAYYEHLSRSVKGSQDAIYSPGRSCLITLGYELK